VEEGFLFTERLALILTVNQRLRKGGLVDNRVLRKGF